MMDIGVSRKTLNSHKLEQFIIFALTFRIQAQCEGDAKCVSVELSDIKALVSVLFIHWHLTAIYDLLNEKKTIYYLAIAVIA